MSELSREDLLAEGAKQARIHGVSPECARVYAQGWAEATRAARERIAELERQRQAVLDACNEADKPVKCRHCGPDIVAGDWSCMQCNNTGWWSAPTALNTAQIRDLLQEQK